MSFMCEYYFRLEQSKKTKSCFDELSPYCKPFYHNGVEYSFTLVNLYGNFEDALEDAKTLMSVDWDNLNDDILKFRIVKVFFKKRKYTPKISTKSGKYISFNFDNSLEKHEIVFESENMLL